MSAIAKGKTDTHKLEAIAVKVRRHIIRMIKEAGSGHPGGSLSCTDMIVALYFGKLKHNPKHPDWPDRDRFILSKGHGCPAWYATLAEAGYFDVKELDTLRQFGRVDCRDILKEASCLVLRFPAVLLGKAYL